MTDLTPEDIEAHAHGHKGPSDIHYVRIALALTVLTSLEVAWSYLPVWDDGTGVVKFIEIAGLMLMMSIKFVVIASNFMHLRWDDKLLTRIFYAGIFLAAGVYLAVLTTLEFWQA